MIKGDKMLTHNFKIINDPSQWDGDMKNFFNSLAEYWLSIHPKPNRRWREEYAMKLYKQLNGDFIEIFARWKIYFSNYCIECGRQLEGDLKYEKYPLPLQQESKHGLYDFLNLEQ